MEDLAGVHVVALVDLNRDLMPARSAPGKTHDMFGAVPISFGNCDPSITTGSALRTVVAPDRTGQSMSIAGIPPAQRVVAARGLLPFRGGLEWWGEQYPFQVEPRLACPEVYSFAIAEDLATASTSSYLTEIRFRRCTGGRCK